MTKNIFIIGTPLQALFAISAVSDYSLSLRETLMLHVACSDQRTNQQTARVLDQIPWGERRYLDLYPPKISWIHRALKRQAAKNRKALRAFHGYVQTQLANHIKDVKFVFIGDSREPLPLHIANSVGFEHMVLLDDGSVTPQVAMNRLGDPKNEHLIDKGQFSFKRFNKRAREAGLSFELKLPESVEFYTMYSCQLSSQDAIREPVAIKRDFQRADFDTRNEVWIIGNNHTEGNLCPEEAYIELIGHYRRFFGNMPLKYFPHRKEDTEKLQTLTSRFDLEVVRPELPLELHVKLNRILPQYIVGTASTVLDSLHWLFNHELQILCFRLPQSYFTGRREKHLKSIQSYHEQHSGGSFQFLEHSVLTQTRVEDL